MILIETALDLHRLLGSVAPGSLAGIGDNVLDCYVHERLAYPGGNALNVAAYARTMFGSRSSYLGIVGTDRFGDHLLAALGTIGVDTSLVRRAEGPNGMAFVALEADGDRRFVGSNRGGVQEGLRLRVTEDDLEHLAAFSGIHTSVFSAIDTDLARLAGCAAVSYDFSTDHDAERIARTAPFLDVAFFSGAGLGPDRVDELGRFAVASGCTSVVVTLGSAGAVGFEAGTAATAAVRPVDAVDALGAGDAFIAGYLTARDAGAGLEDRLSIASASGALACLSRGAFGYPVETGEDILSGMTRTYEPL